MGKRDKHGKDAIAEGVDAMPGRRFPAQRSDYTATGDTRARSGSFAEALEQDEGSKVRVTRHGDEPVEETHPTDVYGNRLTGTMLMADAFEQNARDREGR